MSTTDYGTMFPCGLLTLGLVVGGTKLYQSNMHIIDNGDMVNLILVEPP